MAAFAQIDPVWLYGRTGRWPSRPPRSPTSTWACSKAALRSMPAWEWNFLGHTVTFGALIPFVLPLTIVLGGAALWPFFDDGPPGRVRSSRQRPAAERAGASTASGVAAMTFYGVLWAEGANDVIASKLQVPLYTITWIARVLVFAGPVLAYVVTNACCLALQRQGPRGTAARLQSGIVGQNCPAASSSRSTSRWARRGGRCSRPARCPRCRARRRERQWRARRPHAVPSAGSRRGPTALSPRPSSPGQQPGNSLNPPAGEQPTSSPASGRV